MKVATGLVEPKRNRTFRAIISASVKDSQGEWVNLDALERQVKIWIKERHGTLIDQHSNRPCGEAYSYVREKYNGVDSIIIDAMIYSHHKNDHRVWNAIQTGELKMMSIGGEATVRSPECDTFGCYVKIDDLDLS
ncbi:MAG: XkdF-like putative serine protease domain-containing protein, partial [Patescibacteria group bacterium]